MCPGTMPSYRSLCSRALTFSTSAYVAVRFKPSHCDRPGMCPTDSSSRKKCDSCNVSFLRTLSLRCSPAKKRTFLPWMARFIATDSIHVDLRLLEGPQTQMKRSPSRPMFAPELSMVLKPSLHLRESFTPCTFFSKSARTDSVCSCHEPCSNGVSSVVLRFQCFLRAVRPLRTSCSVRRKNLNAVRHTRTSWRRLRM